MEIGGLDAFHYDPRGCFHATIEAMKDKGVKYSTLLIPCDEQYLSEIHQGPIMSLNFSRLIKKMEDAD